MNAENAYKDKICPRWRDFGKLFHRTFASSMIKGLASNFRKSNSVTMSKSKNIDDITVFSLGKIDRISKIGLLIYTRFFPYQHYFIITFPFFALLIKENLLIESWWSLSYLLPLFFSMIAGFACNELCDSKTDDFSNNVIKRGEVSRKDAKTVITLSIIGSTISALFIYQSLVTIILLIIYNFSSLAYSGLKLRFKTTLLGPFSASFSLWTGPALILLADFSLWTRTSIGLLWGIFLVFSAHEIHHQLYDYSEDKHMDVKTLTTRIGKRNTLIFSTIISITGFIFLLYSMYFNIQLIYIAIFSSFLILYMIFQYIIVQKRHAILLFNLPVKAILITFACIYLGFSSLFTILILMVFFGEISGLIRWFKIS
jgi:4-hydroxybenzoate polyprenyltransferase